MSPHITITESRPLSRQSQRPQTTTATTPRTEGRLVIRPFAAPVVREIPARREALLAGTW